MDPKHAQVLDKYTSECDEDEDEKIRETSMQYMGRELWYRMQNLILAVHDKNAKGPYNPKPVMHAEDLLANDDFFFTGSVMSRKLLRLVVNIARDKPVPQERDIKDNLELMKNTREFLEKEKAEELERKREEKRRKEAEEESLKASTSKEEPVPSKGIRYSFCLRSSPPRPPSQAWHTAAIPTRSDPAAAFPFQE